MTSSQEALQYLSSSPKNIFFSSSDPVTKAVVDNILGKVPKKEKVLLKCNVCNLDFSSQIPLDMHLRGTKHSKKVRSQEILRSLQQEGALPSALGMSSTLRCDICNIISNSSQQLQMHLKGTKHISKCKQLSGQAPTTGSLKRPAPSSAGLGEPDAKVSNYFCYICNIQLNSESQFQQHMDSQKHKNKVIGVKPARKKWNQNPRGNFRGFKQNFGSQRNGKKINLPPLSQSFNMNKSNYTFGESGQSRDMGYERDDASFGNNSYDQGNANFGNNIYDQGDASFGNNNYDREVTNYDHGSNDYGNASFNPRNQNYGGFGEDAMNRGINNMGFQESGFRGNGSGTLNNGMPNFNW